MHRRKRNRATKKLHILEKTIQGLHMKSAFIITLTGPSACGKGLITEEIIDYSHALQARGIDFFPFMFKKDVTRPYRIKEAVAIVTNHQDKVDVNSVIDIPSEDDLVYRTYGDEYALNTQDLITALNENRSPIVVINDVRVVEELKRLYPKQVLSLFIFRHIIPDLEQHKKAGESRGGVSEHKILSRYEKAVALYRVFIENIHIFDRVILNVRENDIELAKIQARGVIDGVLNNKIKLDKKINKGPKLFIVSGNAASGKDDIIKAAKKYGRQQTDILIKSTSRQEEDGDTGEIICKYIPSSAKIKVHSDSYKKDLADFLSVFTLAAYRNLNKLALEQEYSCLQLEANFDDFVTAKYLLEKKALEKMIPSTMERFWKELKERQEACKQSSKELSQQDYDCILSEFFERNTSPKYIDLDAIRKETADQRAKEEALIEDATENKSWYLEYGGKSYIFYENNELYGEPIKYGFEIGNYVDEWKTGKRQKHLVLTASLPNMFRICRNKFGAENVITAFTYSQISKEEHEKHSDAVVGLAKGKEYDDIIRYANHIADFDYALIYAETSLTNLSGNQKDELVDQMFRLFRVYNK